MKHLLTWLVVGVLVAAGSARASKPDTDKEKLQGVWQEESTQFDGKDFAHHATVTFEGGRVTIKTKDETLERTVKLDPTKTPKWMDMIVLRGPDKDNMMLGIYKLEGDTLTICRAMPDNPRPTDFVSKPGGQLLLVVLKREKP